MCGVVTLFTDRDSAIWVFIAELLWVSNVMDFGGEVPAKLTVPACAFEGNIPNVGPFRAFEIFSVFLSSRGHRNKL